MFFAVLKCISLNFNVTENVKSFKISKNIYFIRMALLYIVIGLTLVNVFESMGSLSVFLEFTDILTNCFRICSANEALMILYFPERNESKMFEKKIINQHITHKVSLDLSIK